MKWILTYNYRDLVERYQVQMWTVRWLRAVSPQQAPLYYSYLDDIGL